DTSALDEMALNDSHLHPGAGQAERQRWSGLAGADDDRVEVGHDKPLQQQEASLIISFSPHNGDPGKLTPLPSVARRAQLGICTFDVDTFDALAWQFVFAV